MRLTLPFSTRHGLLCGSSFMILSVASRQAAWQCACRPIVDGFLTAPHEVFPQQKESRSQKKQKKKQKKHKALRPIPMPLCFLHSIG